MSDKPGLVSLCQLEEVRKVQRVTNHLFLVTREKTQYIGCKLQPLPYGEQLRNDILNRTATAMSQEHCFRMIGARY